MKQGMLLCCASLMALIIGCSSQPALVGTSQQSNVNLSWKSDFWNWDSSDYVKSGYLSTVIVYMSNDTNSVQYVALCENNYYRLPQLASNEAYEFSIPNGHFQICSYDKNIKLKKRINLDIEQFKNYFVKVTNNGLMLDQGVPSDSKLVGKGVVVSDQDLSPIIEQKFGNYNFKDDPDNLIFFMINYKTPPIIKINGSNVEAKVNENYFVITPVEGVNRIEIFITGFDNQTKYKLISHYRKTRSDFYKEQQAAQDAEQKRQIELWHRLQAEAEKKKQEAERIAIEGDGSPDDLKCKSYGLKPQDKAYPECRMRLDTIRQEIAHNQRQLDDLKALKAAQDQFDAKQRREIESKCAFVKAQEYARPNLGGFIESMNRANSAYDNCMNGVPQLNTTCTQDGFGSVNCVSR